MRGGRAPPIEIFAERFAEVSAEVSAERFAERFAEIFAEIDWTRRAQAHIDALMPAGVSDTLMPSVGCSDSGSHVGSPR